MERHSAGGASTAGIVATLHSGRSSSRAVLSFVDGEMQGRNESKSRRIYQFKFFCVSRVLGAT